MTSYVEKAIKGSAAVFIMGILASLVSYITRIFLARYLTPDEYGLFYAVFTFIVFFLFFRDLGLNSSLVKYIPEFKVKKQYDHIKTALVSALSFQMLSSVIFIILIFVFGRYLSINYFKNPLSYDLLRILSFYVLGSVFFRLLQSSFQGFQNIKIYSLFEFLKNSLFLIFSLVFFYFGFGIFSPAVSYVLLSFVISLILLPFFLKMFNFSSHRISDFGSVTKKLFLFAIPVFFTGIGGKFISHIDTLILTGYVPIAEVGIYNVILPTSMMFLYFGSSISAAVFPMVSELSAKNSFKKISDGVKLLHKYSFVAIIPPAIILLIFSKKFISLFFGLEYASGYFAMQILMIGMLFYVVAGINNSVISGLGKPKTVAKIILFAAIINTIINFILIPKYGIGGAAFSTTLSYIIVFVLSTVTVNSYLMKAHVYNLWFKILMVGVFFGASLYFFNAFFSGLIGVFVSIILSSVLYIILCIFFKLLDFAELKYYFKLTFK